MVALVQASATFGQFRGSMTNRHGLNYGRAALLRKTGFVHAKTATPTHTHLKLVNCISSMHFGEANIVLLVLLLFLLKRSLTQCLLLSLLLLLLL